MRLDRSFTALNDAERYVAGEEVASKPSVQKFYAVKSGKNPGIYNNWPSAQAQVEGWTKPRHKSFATRQEAQAWMESEAPATPAVSEHQSVDGNTFFTSNDKLITSTTPKPSVQKKRKSASQSKATEYLEFTEADFEPGYGPLPPGSIDGFDSNIRLDEFGNLVYKTPDERRATKKVYSDIDQTRPIRVHTDGSALKNGQEGAIAGVGVWFGPGDHRLVLSHGMRQSVC